MVGWVGRFERTMAADQHECDATVCSLDLPLSSCAFHLSSYRSCDTAPGRIGDLSHVLNLRREVVASISQPGFRDALPHSCIDACLDCLNLSDTTRVVWTIASCSPTAYHGSGREELEMQEGG